ncbi:hypothetical protein [Salmonirosea aquatica]|uniref:Uncharacterized protein n=1 Tax=Salmonirosea aquatica TaxID=2654236 RepID=A0A7C9BI86_9BACT|nr:hypothetical protein [Cytophagaceae bacterium SJW1-29]
MRNLHGIKVGTTVYHLLHGWEGVVREINPQADFPLCIESFNTQDWYTIDGRMFPEDVNPAWVAQPPLPIERATGHLEFLTQAKNLIDVEITRITKHP